MREATRMLRLTEAARAGEYHEDYKSALSEIEKAAREGKSSLSLHYEDDTRRHAVGCLLRAEGFHTVRFGESRLSVRWDQ